MNVFQRLLGDTIKSRLRLFTLLLVFLPPTLSLGFFAGYARIYLKERAQEQLREALRFEREFIEQWVEERAKGAVFLAQLPLVRRNDQEAMRIIFEAYAKSQQDITGAVFVDAEGWNVVDTVSEKRVNLLDREYFKAARRGETHVSDVVIGRTSGKPIIIFSAPVKHVGGDFLGVVFTPVRLATVEKMLETLRVGREGYVFLADFAGKRFGGEGAQAGPANASLPALPDFLLEKAQRGEPFDWPYVNAQGVQVLGASERIHQGRWLLVAEIPVSEVFEAYVAFMLVAVVGGLITLACLSPFMWRLAVSLARPMQRLAEMARIIASGHFENSCPYVEASTGTWEVRTLSKAFCRMHAMVGESVAALKRAAITDQLTGLHNRRYLMQEGARIMEVCARGGKECVCLMLDVDHFKRVNDTHGHHVGDEVLRHVAIVLQQNLRASDIAARFGGEEFAIVAPNADLDHGRLLAERLREAFSCCEMLTETLKVHITVSVGVAMLLPGQDHGEALLEASLRRADAALYAAKAAGRDRVMVDAP